MKYIKKLNESTAKDVLKDATDALTKSQLSKKLDKSYVKDYLKSIETTARKNPGDFVKDYSNFSNADWIEDVEYNMANESVINEKKGGFIAIYKVMGQEFKFGPLKTDDKKSIMAMLSSAIQGGFQLVRVVPADQVKESTIDEKKKGLWANIHAKRKRGEKPAKPGDEDYPETLDIDEAAPRMKKNEDAIYLQDLMNKVANAKKGGSGSRYGKEFDKSKTKALRAIKDMVMYSTIGI